jgi:hypothetical protein
LETKEHFEEKDTVDSEEYLLLSRHTSNKEQEVSRLNKELHSA